LIDCFETNLSQIDPRAQTDAADRITRGIKSLTIGRDYRNLYIFRKDAL